MTRRNFAGETVSKRFCASENGECDWSNYGQALAMMVLPAFVFGVLFLLVFLCYGSYYCCCPCRALKGAKEFTEKSKKKWKIIFFISFLLFLLGTFLGFGGNSKMRSGIIDLGDEITNETQFMYNLAIHVNETFTKTGFYSVNSVGLENTIDAMRTINNQADDSSDTMSEYDSKRQYVVNIILAVPLVVVSFGVIFVFAKMGKAGACIGILSFLLIFGIWFSFGIHYLVGILFSDICYEISQNVDGIDDPNSDTPLKQIVDCTEGHTDLDSLREGCEDAINQTIDAGCAVRDEICSLNFTVQCDTASFTHSLTFNVSCAPTCNDSVLNETKQLLIFDNGTLAPGCVADQAELSIVCGILEADCNLSSNSWIDNVCVRILTVEECATECVDNQTKTNAQDVCQFIDNLNELYQMLVYEILPLLSCEFLKQVFRNIEGAVCDKIISGMLLIVVGQGLAGSILVIGAISFLAGEHRFSKPPSDSDFGYDGSKNSKDIEMNENLNDNDDDIKKPPLVQGWDDDNPNNNLNSPRIQTWDDNVQDDKNQSTSAAPPKVDF
eukprot:Anaeramoba_ignava/c9075_g1_i1.p1 GENE.c9075_g1_i1~~c9075_g1_i1.p1  ORF type:complete len:554 (-),score=134.18 c9075_g1_i1:43-1704(-)